jgi:hypothetical protein
MVTAPLASYFFRTAQRWLVVNEPQNHVHVVPKESHISFENRLFGFENEFQVEFGQKFQGRFAYMGNKAAA